MMMWKVNRALQNMKTLIDYRKRFSNRDKENDEAFENSYKILEEIVNDLCDGNYTLAPSLYESIDDGNLIMCNEIRERNGYIIRLEITKKEDTKI